MKVVADTNVVVSGLLWGGPPNRILRWVRDGLLEIIVCEETTAEVRRVIQYKRFSKRLSDLDTSSNEVFSYFMNLVTFASTPGSIPEVIKADLFDNIFLALASENSAQLIISGDKHLLDLGTYKDIEIVTPSEASRVIETLVTYRG
ncbi:MAG: putative toxin-antitoxin system toxin component, PIN family [Deltaproteobacteria bacterium]|nr:putative toxin-antitoxin system toxin component, PIN family [Deltaproteobacteria bacterium]MBW1910256.1 putative toxin-antitoxin system toxin component, PIN family [Deltaproteobacteria bacterium]MBW2034714.1 putative toxin-antitoxin system toxin component, PIN family [Deltaproteobacteria bacterium]MBW2115725.1 putative toxin-antitoxin system toxin component, PIN family [Deltaproteobacteria bacterium]MBW2169753.1 putative toxin-antitoxin system toxin component, PIN family [Deltaproteobacteria